MSNFLKPIIKILNYLIVIITLVSPAVSISDVVYAPDYSWRLDSSTGITVALKGKPKTKWLSDNITKTTIYTYADKTTFTVSQTVEPTISKSIKGLVQTSTITFGNKKKKTIKETGVLIAGSESMSADLRSKNATYRFSNGEDIAIPTTLKGAPKVKWGSDNITKYTVYTYSDKSTYSTVSRVDPTTSTTWSSDHLVKTMAINFANGKKSKLTEKIQPVSEVIYADDVQLTILKFGDGYVKQTSKKATNLNTTWGSDNVTKTTTYTFANGEKHSVVAVVPGNESAPTYSGNTQTIVITYANGKTSTINNTSTETSGTWGADNVTKTTTYTFANGGTNTVVSTVQPIVSTPVFTAAAYPSNWTTTGTVTKPSVTPLINTFGNGVVTTLENGTTSLPFNQSTLTALSITDPSAVVRSSTTDYNLTWGTPDKDGPAIAGLFPNSSNTLSLSLGYAGIAVTGQTTTGPTLLQPSADVLSAWNNGWTGKGSNILIIDSYANRFGCTSFNGNCHGVITMMATDLIAPGATKFGLDFSFSSNFTGTAFDVGGVNLSSSKSINVVNQSWSFIYPANNWNCNSGCGISPSDAVYNAGITYTSTVHSNLIKFLSGVTSVANISNISNAVITQAAGNDGLDAKYTLTALALAENSIVMQRLLIVGALDKNGTTSNKATIAPYSSYAGSNVAISERFVTANGTMPWNASSVKINGSNFGVSSGTSYAAPLVAGYAAILMHKFPNIDAVKTSSIILDTARYDTLTCHPNCDPTIYGKGEASLSRALAPVGRLR